MADSHSSSQVTADSTASAEARLAEIRSIFKEKGAAAAERATIDLLKDEPKSAKAFMALSRVLARQKRHDDAARAAEKAKGLAPLEIEPLLMIGFVRLREKNHAAAATAFSEALALDATSTRALMGAAVVKMGQGALDEAENLCARAIEQSPNLERAHELMARIRVRSGEKTGAIDKLKELALRSPGNTRATKALVQLMNSEDRKDELLAFFEQDVADNPGDSRRIYRLSVVAINLGRADLAVEHCKAAADSETANISDKVRLIAALTANNDLNEAEAQIGSLGEAKVLQPIATKLRGDIAMQAENHAKAISLYQDACKAARIEPLSGADLAEAGTDEEKAKLWKSYSRKEIVEAVRAFRASRG